MGHPWYVYKSCCMLWYILYFWCICLMLHAVILFLNLSLFYICRNKSPTGLMLLIYKIRQKIKFLCLGRLSALEDLCISFRYDTCDRVSALWLSDFVRRVISARGRIPLVTWIFFNYSLFLCYGFRVARLCLQVPNSIIFIAQQIVCKILLVIIAVEL